MKKKIIFLSIFTILLVGCVSNANADNEKATHLESVDEYRTFTAVKIVDKETGCKYLLTQGDRKAGLVQMLDKDGKPLCQ